MVEFITGSRITKLTVERIENAPSPAVCSISTMRYGQVGYIEPWDYNYSENILNPDAPVFEGPHSFITMKVKRLKGGKYEIEYP